MAYDVIKLRDVKKENMPADLRAETYFDFNAHPFEHQKLFEQTDSVYGAILGIDQYVTKWLADLKKHCGNIPVVLFGNKIDLVDDGDLSSNPDKLTSDINVEKLAKEYRFIGYYKTSALTGQGVTDAFKALVRKLYMVARISDFS